MDYRQVLWHSAYFALGYTIQRPTEDRFLMSQEEIQNKMAVLLGGRAAEMLIFGTPSTGAADDLVKTTDIARAIVTRYGMHAKLGLVAYEEERHVFLPDLPASPLQRRYSDDTASEIDTAVRETVQAAFNTATKVLTRARDVLQRGAELLLAKETLTESELSVLKGELAAPDREQLPGQRVRAVHGTPA